MQVSNEIKAEINSVLANKQQNQEFEARFGEFSEQGFKPSIEIEEFTRLNSYVKSFSKFEGIEYSFIVCYPSGSETLRLTQVLEPPTGSNLSFPWKNSKIIDERLVIKKKIKNIDSPEFNTRFSLCEEKILQKSDYGLLKGQPSFFKSRKRITYSFKGFKIEMSMFLSSKSIDDLEKSRMSYDIEIEVDNSNSDSEALLSFTSEILKVIQNSKTLMSVSLKKNVLKDYGDLVKSCKFSGVQPETIKSSKIDIQAEYALTLKLDGRRSLLFIRGKFIYAINSKLQFSCVEEISDNSFHSTIMDCEFYKGVFWIFDLFVFKGTDLRDNASYTLKTRLENVRIVCKAINNSKFLEKEYFFGNTFTNSVNLLKNDFTSGIDGIIYTLVNKAYPSKKNGCVPLKWKPRELNTIDFKIKKISSDSEKETWELYCYDTIEDILFSVPDYPESISTLHIGKNSFISGSVVEFMFDRITEQFVPLKTRHDKIRGNHISVARDNFETIVYPFDFETLRRTRKNSYFFNMRRYHNWIKSKLLYKYSAKSGSLLDLACGKGGDIHKWISHNIRRVSGYDICSDSIKEANTRLYKVLSNPTTKNFEFSFFQIDLSLGNFQVEQKFDTVSCFFAIHYFFKDLESINRIVCLIKDSLKKDGHFIMTTFCDKELEKISYTLDNSKVKITPTKTSESKESLDSPFGKSIDVWISDTVLDLPTPEYVFDFEYFVGLMGAVGITLIETQLFEETYPEWCENENSISLSEKKLSFLNRAAVFKNTGKRVETVPVVPVVPVVETFPTVFSKNQLKTKKVSELKDILSSMGLLNIGKKEELISKILENK